MGKIGKIVKVGYPLPKRRLNILFRKFKGRCHYCKKRVKMPKRFVEFQNEDLLATADHIYSKMDIRRFLNTKTVLCCYKCNQEKNEREAVIYRKSFYCPGVEYYEGLLVNLLNGNFSQVAEYTKLIK